MDSSAKVFNDPVHGHIELHPLCVKVIDTPQFQRLRELGQLGGVAFVFACASHHRFEHSIGTSYLAGCFVEHLRESHAELHITEADVLCVKLAGLAHDMGHGPFSHLFEHVVHEIDPSTRDWSHEDASVEMFDRAIIQNDLLPEFAHYGLYEDDIHFVKELIMGGQDEAPTGWQWRGRPGKEFLFEIVANKRNGIDVDKFDYFARDCYQLGIQKSFDARRLMKFAKVVQVPGDSAQIAYHEKEVWNIYELFHTRYNLHKRAYQHRVGNAIEKMIADALLKAEPYFRVPIPGGRSLRLSETIRDMAGYEQLTDALLRQIRMTTDPDLAPARNLLERIYHRDLYVFVGQVLLGPVPGGVPAPPTLADLAGPDLKPDDVYVETVKINYGMKDKNPVDRVNFFNPKNGGAVGPIPSSKVSCLIPHVFEEHYVRCYVRRKENRQAAENAFRAWATKVVGADPLASVSPTRKRPRE
eukprot:TRINITY_DN14160_c0_g1_i2.p1 TRINITY_DN14160_c0_g1~~TRINITY_DN14160_c0_g1_i2.p1  ORF type:complete len:470 (-),score=70.03 TRINITY_DN14160_c0_g1_i2:187-1596(-)